MPASISSNTRSPGPSPPRSAATPVSASITRESSPPEAMSRSGPSGTPGLGAMRNSIASSPAGPRASRGVSTTSKLAPSIASSASRLRTAAASLGPAAPRAPAGSPAPASPPPPAPPRRPAPPPRDGELPVPAVEPPQGPLGRGQQRRAPALVAGVRRQRLGAGRRCAAEPLEVTQALALGAELGVLRLARRSRLDLGQLELDQVQLALARARELAQRLQLGPQLAH